MNTDILLPASIYVEKISTFLNLEGRLRNTKKAVSTFKYVQNDWEIFKVIFLFKNFLVQENFSIIGKTILQFFIKIVNYSCCFFTNINIINFKDFFFLEFHGNKTKDYYNLNLFAPFCFNLLNFDLRNLKIINSVINGKFNDYYSMNDHFTRNSKILSLAYSKIIVSSFSTNFLIKSFE